MIATCAECGSEFRARRSAEKYCTRNCANRSIGKQKAAEEPKGTLTTVWSCGGGIDSTAIAVLIATGQLPVPDIAFMVDVGWEKNSTWEHVTKVLRPRLADVGCVLRVVKSSDFTDASPVDVRGYLAIPGFLKRGDAVVKCDTRCSGPWKLTVAKRWLRQHGVDRVENWIGFAADETRRCKPSGQKWFGHRWPLVELGMTREDCVYLIGKEHWPMPQHTSCVMCPNQSDREWRRMAQQEPDEFARACAIEKDIQCQVPEAYLHRSCQPLAEWASAEPWDGEVDAAPRECNPYTQCTAPTTFTPGDTSGGVGGLKRYG